MRTIAGAALLAWAGVASSADGPGSSKCRHEMTLAVHTATSVRSSTRCLDALLTAHHEHKLPACERASGQARSFLGTIETFCAVRAPAAPSSAWVAAAPSAGVSDDSDHDSPPTMCSSTASCAPGTYCARDSLSRWDPGSCSPCDSLEVGNNCDEISQDCCSSAVLIACGEKAAHKCNRACTNSSDCVCGQYCAMGGKCTSCTATNKNSCDAISGGCCSSSFLDVCPSDPFKCASKQQHDCANRRWFDGYAVNFTLLVAGRPEDGEGSARGFAVYDPANNRSMMYIAGTSYMGYNLYMANGEYGVTIYVDSSREEDVKPDCTVLRSASGGDDPTKESWSFSETAQRGYLVDDFMGKIILLLTQLLPCQMSGVCFGAISRGPGSQASIGQTGLHFNHTVPVAPIDKWTHEACIDKSDSYYQQSVSYSMTVEPTSCQMMDITSLATYNDTSSDPSGEERLQISMLEFTSAFLAPNDTSLPTDLWEIPSACGFFGCNQTLHQLCGANRTISFMQCVICAGAHNVQTKAAGCAIDNIKAWCQAPPFY
jgi:hypothetical protein